MARLPHPGSDQGTWGTILNDFLSQSLRADGVLKPASVTADALATDAVTSASLSDGSIGSQHIDTANSPAAGYVLGHDGSNLVWVVGQTVSSVAGKTGAVTLTKTDVGLANVDNTSDASKPVSTATQTAIQAETTRATNAETTLSNRISAVENLSGLAYIGTSASPVTDPSTARPVTSAPVYWLCGPGITPVNALDGDLIVNKST